MGKLKKLKILAYKDETYGRFDSSVEVPINPESYKHGHTTAFNQKKTTDTAGVVQKFIGLQPQSLSFDLYFDATGVIPDQGSELQRVMNQKKSVQEAIKTFKDVVYEYDGDIHSPKYLKVLWGGLLFKCRMTELSIDYTLFSPNGQALRAKASASFQEYLSPEALAKLANKSSPDLTHVRTVRMGDTLPLMCDRIYGDSKYYLQVARVNGLDAFRALEVGSSVTFPPLI